MPTLELAQNVLYVSAEFEDFSAPYYTTIALALAAASSGDTIVVYPGTYDEQITLVTGVNLHFMPGAILDYTGTGNVAAILDGGSDVSCVISGNGQFKRTPASGGGTATDLFSVTGTNSYIRLEADLLQVATSSSTGTIVEVTGSAAVVVINVKRVNGSGSSINAHQFKISAASRVMINCGEVIKPVSANGVVSVTGAAVVYFSAEYVESAEDAPIFSTANASSILYVRVARCRNTHVAPGSGSLVSIASTGGIINILGGEFISDSTGTSSCVLCDAGTIRIVDARIVQLGDSTTAHVVDKGAGTLILSNASLVATNASSESITAGEAQDVSVYGDAVSNRDKNANVTIRVGTLTVDTTYVV